MDDDASSQAEFLRTFLAGRDAACPSCGYNLRDLRNDRCPECGDALALCIGLTEPRQAAAIVGLIGLAAGAGLSGLLLVYVLIRTTLFGGWYGWDEFVWLNVGGVLIEGAALAGWLRAWRAVRRMPAGRRWALAAGCWTLTLANVLVFSWNIN